MNAYEKVYNALQTVMVSMPGGLGRFPKLYDVVSDALKTKPRNCDVGTAEEQNLRHSEWCHKHGIDGDGDVNCASQDMHCHLCFAKWSQLPYEEGGAE